MKQILHSQTSTVAPLKFGNEKVTHPTFYNGCNYLFILRSNFTHVNNRDHWKFQKKYANTVVAFDYLVPCVSRSTAATVLIMQDKWVFIVIKARFWLIAAFHCQQMIENGTRKIFFPVFENKSNQHIQRLKIRNYWRMSRFATKGGPWCNRPPWDISYLYQRHERVIDTVTSVILILDMGKQGSILKVGVELPIPFLISAAI